MSQSQVESAEEPKEVWLEQMHVFPDDTALYEHKSPYVVEFEATTGVTRTRELTDEEIEKIRKFNKFPAEQIVTETVVADEVI